MTEDFDCGDRCFKTKTPISAELLREIDAHYSGGLTAWKLRYRPLVIRQKDSIEFLNIAVTQLFESYRLGRSDALNILDQVIACTTACPCFKILCPACRAQRQSDTAKKVITAFANYRENEIKFMTLLIRVEKDADRLPDLIRSFRKRFTFSLHNHAEALGEDGLTFQMIGAFEIDLKNLSTQWDAGPESRELVKSLGYNPGIIQSQYLLHLHAVVGPMDIDRQEDLSCLIEKALGTELLPDQVRFGSLHEDKSKDDNLSRLASYMFKARLQFSDNVYDTKRMAKRARYHTPYKGKQLLDYLNIVDEMQNFKGLKYDFGISASYSPPGS